MHPFLFDWVVNGHHLRPPTYGVLLATAFSVAYFVSLWRAEKLGDSPKHIENLFLLIVFASIIGSRLFHVFFEDPSYYASHPAKILAVWEGGYTFYGAFLSATLAIWVYCKAKKVPFLEFGDIAAASSMIGLAIGRVGCFMAGCCWGREAHVPWAVTFTHPESFAVTKNIPLHPTQLYEALGGLLIFCYLQWRFKHRAYVGQVGFHTLALYAVLRFIVEYFRGDDYRGYMFGGTLSYSQFVSLAILPFAIAGMFLFSKTTSK